MIVVNPTGGGLSNGKLAQATATPADVLSGKTFFAGGREMQIGTLTTPKVKVGSMRAFDTSVTINVGFNPKLVIVYCQSSRHNWAGSCAFWYNNVSYLYFVYDVDSDIEWKDKNRIKVNGNKFTVSGDAVDVDEYYYPFFTDMSTINYIAIG